MDKFLITVVLVAIVTQSVSSDNDLEQQNSNQDHLNPLNDQDSYDSKNKDQDKRTIFNPSISNYAWAKHVAIRPSGAKHVLGYSAVDLKLRPVLRPIGIKHEGYHYGKPKIHFHLKKPVVQVPIRPALRPSVSHIKPLGPVHVDHFHADSPVHVTPNNHVDHIHVRPAHVDHVHIKPAAIPVPQVHAVPVVQQVNQLHAVQLPHVAHVQNIPIAHQDHIHTVGHINHVHALPAPIHLHHVQPVVSQFVPSPLFEVTKPNLGVLPLGAIFPSQVLKDIPAPNLAPAIPVHAHSVPAVPTPAHVHPFVPTHPLAHIQPRPVVAPVPHFAPQPIVQVHPQPVAQVFSQSVPHIHTPAVAHGHQVEAANHIANVHPAYPAGTGVEYHGAINFINLLKNQTPVLPQVSANAAYPLLPNHFHLNFPQIPQHTQLTAFEQHDSQTPTAQPNLFSTQQHLPLDGQSHFHDAGQNIFQQQLPNTQTHFQPQLPLDGYTHFQDAGQNVFQQQVPNTQTQFQQQLPLDGETHFQDAGHNVFEQQLPNTQTHFQQEQPISQGNQAHFQPADQVSTQHFFQPNGFSGQFQPNEQSEDQGYVYQKPDLPNIQHSIQPGQTDVQLPLHLPQHPNYDSGRQLGQASEISQSVFRPSIQLEPPYKK